MAREAARTVSLLTPATAQIFTSASRCLLLLLLLLLLFLLLLLLLH